ncbi:MAG: MBL fold metallo-hydrolase [Syntrophobacteraceae bacterium]
MKEEGMDRREFLRFSMATGAMLVVGDALALSGVSEAKTSITEVDKLSVWVITDNYYDALRPEAKVTKRFRVVPGRSIHAEHGLSYYIETTVDGKTSSCMFDYGLDPQGVLHNIRMLGLDLGKTDAFALSHGHFDHFSGAVAILKANQATIKKSTPFYVGEETFCRRFSLRPNTTEAADLGKLEKGDIESLGLKVIEIKNPTEIIPGAYFTGNIERVTPYEKVPPTLLIQRADKPEPDDFRGEQSLMFLVKGKGLVVLSGCAHAGIINTVKHARKVTGAEKIHAVMGGFHLINAKPEIIQNTVADIKAIQPDVLVPTHCTGFEAILQFQKEMPDQFILNTAGTKYTFST